MYVCVYTYVCMYIYIYIYIYVHTSISVCQTPDTECPLRRTPRSGRLQLMDDIFSWVCSRPIKPCYIFELPGGMKKDRLADLYNGIEAARASHAGAHVYRER